MPKKLSGRRPANLSRDNVAEAEQMNKQGKKKSSGGTIAQMLDHLVGADFLTPQQANAVEECAGKQATAAEFYQIIMLQATLATSLLARQEIDPNDYLRAMRFVGSQMHHLLGDQVEGDRITEVNVNVGTPPDWMESIKPGGDSIVVH